ncbi:MAG: carbon storage regulator [Gammaproteobacteria bacterium]
MLAITRREGESFYIFVDGLEPIQILLAELDDRGRARIAIEAPESVWIWREELLSDE